MVSPDRKKFSVKFYAERAGFVNLILLFPRKGNRLISQNPSSRSIVLVILLLADLVYTYLQNYYSVWLDGDMSAIVIATRAYKKVLEDPFAFSVLFNQEHYAATNRFFIHWFMQFYCKNAPALFQSIVSPVDSVFVAMAVLRTGLQLALIVLLSSFISGTNRIFNLNFLTAAALITPLFQIAGYEEFMGVTYNAITYTFFYSLPLVCMLLYFKPFYFRYVLNKGTSMNFFKQIYLFLLMVIIAFGGSLGAPVLIIACSTGLLYNFLESYRKAEGQGGRLKRAFSLMDRTVVVQFISAILVSLYSLYAGTFNSENSWATISLAERYMLLPKGFIRIMTFKLGSGLLLGVTIIYFMIIRKDRENKKLTFIKWLGLFCLIFILMLPLGGYREYRPLIIRSDTFTPVTISIFMAYGILCMILLKKFSGKKRTILISTYIIISAIYMNADRWPKNENGCQRDFMNMLRNSEQKITELPSWCTLLSWSHYTDWRDSELSAELLQIWGVTKEKRPWFQVVN